MRSVADLKIECSSCYNSILCVFCVILEYTCWRWFSCWWLE